MQLRTKYSTHAPRGYVLCTSAISKVPRYNGYYTLQVHTYTHTHTQTYIHTYVRACSPASHTNPSDLTFPLCLACHTICLPLLSFSFLAFLPPSR